MTFNLPRQARAFSLGLLILEWSSLPLVASAEHNVAPPIAIYDQQYPEIDYAGDARRNPIADLQRRMHQLDPWQTSPRGYLDALLAALDVSPASQVLVFSKTSLQAAHINSRAPRAIYFNDTTYVAWVQGSDHLEAVTIDADRGPVFFTVHNAPPRPLQFKRESMLCMACHDSAALRGGGVPTVLVRSSPIEGEMNPAGRAAPVQVTHATAIEDRWGGWYVTGRLGVQLHLGNTPLAGPPDPTVQRITNRVNLDTLAGYFDTSPYSSPTSDVVALLVFEHQAHVQNLITQAKYALAARRAVLASRSFAALSSDDRAAIEAVLLPLARAMLFQDERRLLGRIRGNAGFEASFEARGPFDRDGRSLRRFDLTSRMFKYPLSYLVYSPAFDSLPPLAKDYVYEQFARALSMRSGNAQLDRDRADALSILAATKSDFAAVVERRATSTARPRAMHVYDNAPHIGPPVEWRLQNASRVLDSTRVPRSDRYGSTTSDSQYARIESMAVANCE